jgi:hypothetical protein
MMIAVKVDDDDDDHEEELYVLRLVVRTAVSDYTYNYLFLCFTIVSSSMFKNIDSSGSSSENNITTYNAIEVVHVIVDTVTHLFGCMDCR